MRARPTLKSILAKLSKEEQQVLLQIENENVAKQFRCVTLRFYLAAVAALWDTDIVKYRSSKKWDAFLIALCDIISGHAEGTYSPSEARHGADMAQMARDMHDYILGEGIKSDVLEQLYEQIMREEEKDI